VGAFYGNSSLLGKQILACVVAMAYSTIVTYFILKLLVHIIGIRVSAEEELAGLDHALHDERWGSPESRDRSPKTGGLSAVRARKHAAQDDFEPAGAATEHGETRTPCQPFGGRHPDFVSIKSLKPIADPSTPVSAAAAASTPYLSVPRTFPGPGAAVGTASEPPQTQAFSAQTLPFAVYGQDSRDSNVHMLDHSHVDLFAGTSAGASAGELVPAANTRSSLGIAGGGGARGGYASHLAGSVTITECDSQRASWSNAPPHVRTKSLSSRMQATAEAALRSTESHYGSVHMSGASAADADIARALAAEADFNASNSHDIRVVPSSTRASVIFGQRGSSSTSFAELSQARRWSTSNAIRSAVGLAPIAERSANQASVQGESTLILIE
jgi:hypothetical protein